MERWGGEETISALQKEMMTAANSQEFGALAMGVLAARRAILDLFDFPRQWIEYLEELEETNATDRR